MIVDAQRVSSLKYDNQAVLYPGKPIPTLLKGVKGPIASWYELLKDQL